MAYLIACADGDWTAAATWQLVNATGVTQLDSQASNQAVTTAFVSSAAFTPGAITIDGIAVKVATRSVSPTGTMTVRLAQGGVAVANTTVTINVSDLPDDIGSAGTSYVGCSIGWTFFRFSTNVTLVAATAYTVQVTTSNASQVNLFTNGTAGNWCRLLRTTTTQAPAAGDSMFICGEWTAAATKTDRTVTYDQTASTDYGGASTSLASVGVSKGGTLLLQNTAATDYVFRLSGLLQFWAESVHDFGVTDALPTDSTFTLEFDCAADNDFGIVSYAGLNFAGSDCFGTGIVRTILTADAAATDTSLTVADDTGWRSGDVIAIAPTQRTVTQGEERPLNADAGATSLAFTTGLSFAHAGNATNETQADVVVLTRNFTVTSTGAVQTFIYVRGPLPVACSWVAFERGGTTARAGLDIGGGVAHTFDYCSFFRCKDDAIAPLSGGLASIAFTNCTSWSTGNTTAGAVLQAGTNNTLTAMTATDCTFLNVGTSLSLGLYAGGGCAVSVSGCRFAGFSEAGLRVDSIAASVTVEDSDFYCSGAGSTQSLFINSGGNFGIRIRRCKVWRNNSTGGISVTACFDVDIEDCTLYGNGGANILWSTSVGRILNCTLASETGFATASGVTISPGTLDGAVDLEIHGCDFSQVVNNRIAHTTDITQTTATARFRLLVTGTPLRAATEVSAVTFKTGSYVAFQRRDDTADLHTFRKYGYGTIDIETSTVGDAAPSMKMSPESAAVKFESQKMGYPVAATKQITFSVKVRKNGTYNGAAPRLVLKANGAIGINKDVVLDTHTAAADTWETLTGQMPAAADEDGVAQVVVDCDGTAGAIFVDDFSAVST